MIKIVKKMQYWDPPAQAGMPEGPESRDGKESHKGIPYKSFKFYVYNIFDNIISYISPKYTCYLLMKF